MTNRFTRARSICGSCSGESGTLSADCRDGAGDGTNAVVPGCARSTSRPQSMPATAMPLLIRNVLRVSDVFMNATLRRAHQIYFSNIAIFLGHHSATFSPRPRRHSAALVKQRAKRTEAGEPAFQTNRRHWYPRFFEQKLRPIQSATVEILMRRLMKHGLKHTKQMERRETCGCGNFRQRDRRSKMSVQIIPGVTDASKQRFARGDATSRENAHLLSERALWWGHHSGTLATNFI